MILIDTIIYRKKLKSEENSLQTQTVLNKELAEEEI